MGARLLNRENRRKEDEKIISLFAQQFKVKKYFKGDTYFLALQYPKSQI